MYNKLFTKILDSSIWLESKPTRIVWVTFIAVMDESGFAQFATVENVARRANVTIAEAQKALDALEGPDPNSSDPDNEGRRLERVPGGWMVLNAQKYRELVTRAVIREKTAARVKRHRERRNADVTVPIVTAAPLKRSVTPSETETETEVQKKDLKEPDLSPHPLAPVQGVNSEIGTSSELSSQDGTGEVQRAGRAAASVFVAAWNDLTTLPIGRCRELTPKRRTHIQARLRDHPLAYWREVFTRVEASPFCRGENDRGWKASFDWIVATGDNAVKALEGKYDATPHLGRLTVQGEKNLVIAQRWAKKQMERSS